MFCPQCGENQQPGAKFCYKCGCRLDAVAPASDVRSPQPAHAQQQGRGAIILILGILSIVMFGPLTGIPAWVMGHGDLKEIQAGRIPQSEHGLTTGGMVLGIIGTCLGGLIILGIILAIGVAIIGTSHL